MVKEIITYPSELSKEFGANVRFFDENLFNLIQDLKDTIEANNLKALSAFQIGSPYNVIVIKQDNNYLELINPRIIKKEGYITTKETTAYFKNLSANVKRYEKIKIMYEDRDKNVKYLEADGELSIIIQRKLDYSFGSTFIIRLSKEEREKFLKQLEYGSDVILNNDCPTNFIRDKILNVFNYSFIASLIGIILSFFINIYTFEKYLLIFMLLTLISYFLYAQYESKKYKNCTSCQIGNIIGTTLIGFAKLTISFILYITLL